LQFGLRANDLSIAGGHQRMNKGRGLGGCGIEVGAVMLAGAMIGAARPILLHCGVNGQIGGLRFDGTAVFGHD
jgi:hypothetical protein